MNNYDEYEVIDADTKKRHGRFNDLKSARNMAQGWANAHSTIKAKIIPMKRGKKIDDFLIDARPTSRDLFICAKDLLIEATHALGPPVQSDRGMMYDYG